MHSHLSKLPGRHRAKRTKLPGGEWSNLQIRRAFCKGPKPRRSTAVQFLARSESEPFPKSGSLISVCPISRALANGFQVGCSESVLDPGGKQYAFDRRIVRQFWSGSELRTSVASRTRVFFAEALTIFMECCLGFFMVGDCLFAPPAL